MKPVSIPFYVENRYKDIIDSINLKYSLSIGNVIDIINDNVNFEDSSKLRMVFHTFIKLAIEADWIELAKILKKDYKDDIVESQLIYDLMSLEVSPDVLVEMVDADSFRTSKSAFALSSVKTIIHHESSEYFEILEDNDGLFDSVLAGVNDNDFKSWIVRRKFSETATKRCKIIIDRYPEFADKAMSFLTDNPNSDNFAKFFPEANDLFVF